MQPWFIFFSFHFSQSNKQISLMFTHKSLLSLIAMALIAFLMGGCGLNDDRIAFEEDPGKLSKPGGAVTEINVTGSSASSLQVSVDLYLFDRFGQPRLDLETSNFNIQAASLDVQASLNALDLQIRDENNAYEAALLIDQSGSMVDNDPDELRLDAAKLFLSRLGENDQATAGFFPANTLFGSPVRIFGDFTGRGNRYVDEINDLYGEAGGNTPLYIAAYETIEYTDDRTSSNNRAVVVFTDGEDTEGDRSLQEVINYAQATGIKLYTVGLSRGVDFAVLGNMAYQTGGAFMWAADAPQLISMFGTLGNLLEGSADTYQAVWDLTLNSGSFRSGQRVDLEVMVTLENGEAFLVPFTVVVP